uniref:Uncharacterized protein n=1 Tax=Arundo donax TaxID=35708 RepID=A0A0A9A967_ARUDO
MSSNNSYENSMYKASRLVSSRQQFRNTPLLYGS